MPGGATQLTAGWKVMSLRALDRSQTLRAQGGVIVSPTTRTRKPPSCRSQTGR